MRAIILKNIFMRCLKTVPKTFTAVEQYPHAQHSILETRTYMQRNKIHIKQNLF